MAYIDAKFQGNLSRFFEIPINGPLTLCPHAEGHIVSVLTTDSTLQWSRDDVRMLVYHVYIETIPRLHFGSFLTTKAAYKLIATLNMTLLVNL